MIEIKAEATVDKSDATSAHVSIKGSMNGSPAQVVHESIAIVREVSNLIKKNDRIAHLMFLEALASNASIFLGGEDGEKAKADLAEAMSRSILKKGVN